MSTKKLVDCLSPILAVVDSATAFHNFFMEKYKGEVIQCPYIRDLFLKLQEMEVILDEHTNAKD